MLDNVPLTTSLGRRARVAFTHGAGGGAECGSAKWNGHGRRGLVPSELEERLPDHLERRRRDCGRGMGGL